MMQDWAGSAGGQDGAFQPRLRRQQGLGLDHLQRETGGAALAPGPEARACAFRSAAGLERCALPDH